MAVYFGGLGLLNFLWGCIRLEAFCQFIFKLALVRYILSLCFLYFVSI